MNGLEKKLPRVKLRDCDSVGVFIQFCGSIHTISCNN
jgi:hypothetical protein